MARMTAALLAEGISQHTGESITPKQIQFKQDPKVRNTWAVRVSGFPSEDDRMDILLVLDDVQPSVEAIDEAIEEVEYDSWPPRSGELKFFW